MIDGIPFLNQKLMKTAYEDVSDDYITIEEYEERLDYYITDETPPERIHYRDVSRREEMLRDGDSFLILGCRFERDGDTHWFERVDEQYREAEE